MFDNLSIILILAAFMGYVVMQIVSIIGAPFWLYYVVLSVVGITGTVINARLIRHYISKNAPEFDRDEMIHFADGTVPTWYLTSGLGIVPRWVSLLGLLSYACFPALLLPLILSVFRH